MTHRYARDSEVQFIVDLANKPYIEEVVCEAPRADGSALCVLYRFDRSVRPFRASADQVRKIRAHRGKLRITSRMIKRASY